MNLRFDTYTLQGLQEQGVQDVHVFTKKMGCAGRKVFFEALQSDNDLEVFQTQQNLNIHCTAEDAKLLEGGQIAVAKGKTYFSSPQVKGRCGCGTSISFSEKKIDLSMAKIHRLSEKLGNIPEIQKKLKKNS